MLAWLALRGSVLSYPRCLAFSVSLSQVLHDVGLVGSAPLTVQLPPMDVELACSKRDARLSSPTLRRHIRHSLYWKLLLLCSLE